MSNFVTIQTDENQMKLRNLNLVWIFIWFCWILFHFTIIYFFWLVLESMFLTWLFLWLWNLTALLVDIPLWVLQKYIKPKTFLVIWATFMLLAILIFIKFIYFEWISDAFLPAWKDAIDVTINYVWNFLWSGLNLVLIILCACLYWLIKETFDVTTLSYIFNNSTPSEYASLISKYWIHFWIWSMIWLVFSWILLAINIKIAIIIFFIIVVCFLIFILTYFDNTSKTVNLSDFKKIKLDVIKSDLSKKSQDFVKNINTKNLIEISQKSKVVLLKPVEIKNSIDFWEVAKSTKEEFKRFKSILVTLPPNIMLLGFVFVICLYWFWDTFVSTFLVEFLGKILDSSKDSFIIKSTGWIITWYVFLWLIVIPAFVFQDFFIKMSKKVWVLKVILFWTLISSISMFCFGLFDTLWLVFLFWLLNSVWYAASMPIAQSVFSQVYNIQYAQKYNLKQIDSTISAAPLKCILNFANVVWVILGWLFVSLLSFNWFFIFFSIVLGWLFIYWSLNSKKFNVWNLDEESLNSEDVIEDITPRETQKSWDVKKSDKEDIDKEFE